MIRVLPAFTGHVPPSFPGRFPAAHCKITNWKNGFKDTYILDPADSLFAAIGKKFLAEQTALFGTDHFYSADTFNENEPPSDDPAFLSGLSARIYDGMKEADPAAVWVMQGWLFYSDRKFWKSPQIEALLNAVQDDRMLLLDLAAEIEPVWKRTRAFYGKPWIWNMLNNFGGNVNLFGRMDGVAAGPAMALSDSASGLMQGIGLTMEGIAQNPVMYELMMQHTWQKEPVSPGQWLESYILNRYGYSSPDLVKAWDILRRTVYNGQLIRDGAESIITGRPTLDSTTVWTRTALNYKPEDLLPAWDLLVGSPPPTHTDGFQFDLVDVTRQVLPNYASVLHEPWIRDKAPDFAAFENNIRQGEWNWVHEQKKYPISPAGDPISEVKKLFGKYRLTIGQAYKQKYDIRSYGAVGDGRSDNTRFIQKAIDEATASGGATVLIPAGKFLTGVLNLKSNVTLHLAAGAELLGSTNRMDYGPGPALPLLNAEGQKHIAITGSGTIDGQGEALLIDLYSRLKAGTIRDAEWQKPNPWGQVRPAEENRPMIIKFTRCEDVIVKGITLKNALDWVQDYKSCSNITIDSIRVESNTFWNNDGIDLVDCKNVRLTNSFFNADDDGICLKSEDRNDSCDNIYIAHCTVRSSASAVNLRTAGRGGFKRITIPDITVYDTYRSAIALECVDGGQMEQVDIRDIKATNTGNAIFIRSVHRNKNSPSSSIRHIYIGDVTVEIPSGKPDQGYPMEGPPLRYPHNAFPSAIVGLQGHPIEDVVLENIKIVYPGGGKQETTGSDSLHPAPEPRPVPENPSDYPEFSMFGELPSWGLYVRHADSITLRNLQLTSTQKDYRPACIFVDVNRIVMKQPASLNF